MEDLIGRSVDLRKKTVSLKSKKMPDEKQNLLS